MYCGEYTLIKSLLANGVYTYIYVYTYPKKKLEFLIIDSLTNVTNQIFFIYYKDNTKLQIYSRQ